MDAGRMYQPVPFELMKSQVTPEMLADYVAKKEMAEKAWSQAAREAAAAARRGKGGVKSEVGG